MKILLAGGGSGGPVAPLIAVAQTIRETNPSTQFLLVGTQRGPERQMAKNSGIEFQAITTGKFRRYLTWRNFAAPFLLIVGLFQAFKILRTFRPDCILGAGSFVQVPIVIAGWFLRIPSVIHQQDVQVSLANRLCEIFVKKITVCFESSLTDFAHNFGFFYKPKKEEKVVQVGNPFRQELAKGTKEKGLAAFGLKADMPVLLVLGGGTGSEFINDLIFNSLPELSQVVQIVHSVGVRGKKAHEHVNYKDFEFISDMASAYAAADIVVARGGLSTLTELANLNKVSMIIPMPNTHQEYNGYLLKQLNAALVFDQKEITSPVLTSIIRKIIFDLPMQKQLASNIGKIMPKGSAEKIVKIILGVVQK